jgi:hypothetical protein
MAHNIDLNKVQKIEAIDGIGYAYGGRIYSEKQWKDILHFNAGGFKRGGRALAAQEEAAWNKEMGIDDASVRADEAAINASKDALEQSYSDKNDAAEDDRIARYSSSSDIYNNRESSMNTAYDTAEANYAEREANPLPIRARPTVAKGAFDETGDAENAPVSLINNQTTYKKPVKKEKEKEVIDYSNVTDDKDAGITPTNASRKNADYTELERITKLNEKSRELDKLWEAFKKSHPGITSRQWYNSSVGGTADLKSGEYVQDPIVTARNKKYQKDHPEEYKSYTWNPQFRKGESVLGSSSFSKPFTGSK